VAADDPIAPPGRGDRGAAEDDSRLRSVFLQHRLIVYVRELRGVGLPTAKFAVEHTVERLLAVPGGLEPLMLLQRDEPALARATAVAVMAVALAREAGWPIASLADLGAAALLADLGAVLGDDDDPGRAAFHWLLDRGTDDFWLRCALVARHLHRGAGGAGAIGSAQVVRLARAVVLGQPPGDDIAPELRALAATLPA
jgi:hypothetical protein